LAINIRCNICRQEITNLQELVMVRKSEQKIYYHKRCANRLGLNKFDEIDITNLEAELEEKRLSQLEHEKQRQETEQPIDKYINEIIITTTNNVDGYRVNKYIDIESVEIVIGTGVFSEVTAGIGDIFGLRSRAYESKLADAKKTAMKLLKYNAYEKGGNAVIGIDIDYTEFSGNRVGLIINGTVVEIEPIESIKEIKNEFS